MRKVLSYFLGGVAVLWLQLTVAPWLKVGEIKPDFPLILVCLMALGGEYPWLFLYAVALGLGMDTFSHGVLGVYGLSYLLVFWVGWGIARLVYEKSLGFYLSLLGGLALLAGAAMGVVFELLGEELLWWRWVLGPSFFLALYQVAWGVVAVKLWKKATAT